MGKFWINCYDLTFTEVIRRREKDLPSFRVEVRENQALIVEGTEFISRIQVVEMTVPLGGSERKLSIKGATSGRGRN